MSNRSSEAITESGDTSTEHANVEDVKRGSKRPRGRTGCLNCRRRRKKCDESKPSCTKCRKLGDRCEWDNNVTFRLSGIDSTHPSMRARKASSVGQQSFQMVDVTFDNSTQGKMEQKKRDVSPRVVGDHDSNDEVKMETDLGSNRDTQMQHVTSVTGEGSFGDDPRVPSATQFPTSIRDEGNTPASGHHSAVSVGSNIQTTSGFDQVPTNHEIFPRPFTAPRPSVSATSNAELPDLYGFTAAQLGTLDFLTETQNLEEPLLWSAYQRDTALSPTFDPFLPDSPDTFSLYYPNAEYRDLHTTLYNHMVETARGTGFTRQPTPEVESGVSPTQGISVPQLMTGLDTAKPSPPRGLSAEREMILWRNYLDEIVVWLDMFDHDCHFRNSFPILARDSRALQLSILAVSARQLERMDPDKPYTESLGLYQEAIQLIVEDLHSMDTAVIGACVLLCVLEMMSSSPRDWARHLDGCAMLIKAAGINGVSGGVRQAIFWCFARMDMWGGFLTDTNTKIPTSLWFLPSGSMSAAVSRFKADFKTFDQYANYAVFLCASVLNVISNHDQDSYTSRWKALFDLLEDWYENRPAEMRPLISRSDDETSFPMVLYANAPAISGNQLYHAAALLLLQTKPKEVRFRSHKSLFWHARQICGITATNSSHGAYTNAPQPLWIAGRVLSHPSEHRVVLELLNRIERDTGFATSWRADDLKYHWGEIETA